MYEEQSTYFLHTKAYEFVGKHVAAFPIMDRTKMLSEFRAKFNDPAGHFIFIDNV